MTTDSYAREIACNSIEQSYNPTIATVSQKQEYADCIDMLYPQSSPLDVVIVKVVIVLWILTFTVCARHFYKNRSIWDSLPHIFLGSFLCSIILIAGLALLVFLVSFLILA